MIEAVLKKMAAAIKVETKFHAEDMTLTTITRMHGKVVSEVELDVEPMYFAFVERMGGDGLL